jgi:hypothetical protein
LGDCPRDFDDEFERRGRYNLVPFPKVTAAIFTPAISKVTVGAISRTMRGCVSVGGTRGPLGGETLR